MTEKLTGMPCKLAWHDILQALYGFTTCTCDQQLIHCSAIIPSVDAVMHAQGLDSMHCCLADAGRSLRHHKSLHCAVLPFHNPHAHGHTIRALLTPAPPTAFEAHCPTVLRKHSTGNRASLRLQHFAHTCDAMALCGHYRVVYACAMTLVPMQPKYMSSKVQPTIVLEPT